MSSKVFNILDVEAAESKGFDPVPRGRYHVVIERTEFRESKAGNGMISVMYDIGSGEYSGKKLFDNWVLSEAALPFLRAKLEGVMGEAAFKKWAAKGVTAQALQRLADGGKLIGIELWASVGTQKNKETREPQNVVQSVAAYEAIEEEETEEEYA